MKKIRIVSCGAGNRAYGQILMLARMEEYDLVAVCDLYKDKAETIVNKVTELYGQKPLIYTDYIKMFEEVKPDAVLVSTPWDTHIEISCDAMERGIAVAMEVGGAYCEEECWKLVDTYERTKTPFFFLENICYNKEELLATALARNGVLGEIVYCHGAYRHDLRHEVTHGRINRHYRLKNYMEHNRENYPTHEFGPIAKIIGINRGNKMLTLVSRASKARGLSEFIKARPQLQDLRHIEFNQGDIVETLIKCENGELVSLKLDTTLPVFYSREFNIRGTKGAALMEFNMVLEDGKFSESFSNHDGYAKYINNASEYHDKYLCDLWKGVTPEIEKEGHGGVDYFELKAFAKHLNNNEEMALDVYDAAAWMCISYLSEESIKTGKEMQVPDFTRGKYKNRPILDVTELPIYDK